MLASRIAKELEKSKHCGIYEPELSRIWPDNGKPREAQIALFVEQHGRRLHYFVTDHTKTATTEPNRILSPCFNSASVIETPLTCVPFVECKSLSR
jgi:hypothetical protein